MDLDKSQSNQQVFLIDFGCAKRYIDLEAG